MDFFKSAFSGGREEVAAGTQGDCPRGAGARGGGFGGLVKTLASRSESAIQTCRRDLGEFGTGLLKETAALRAAIRDLPSSLGAAAAPESPASADRAADGSGGQAGDARATLIGRVLASRDQQEEVLSWDVEEDEEDHHHHHREEVTEEEQRGRRKHRADSQGDGQGQAEEEEEEEAAIAGGKPVEGGSQKLGKVASSPTPQDHASSETKWEKNDDVTMAEQVVPTKLGGDGILLRGNAAEGAAATGGDIGDVADTSNRPPVPPEEDDVGWDEIEDLGDDDDDDEEEKKVGASGGTRDARKIDLRKRLSSSEEDDEDLSWDFEDDDPIDP